MEKREVEYQRAKKGGKEKAGGMTYFRDMSNPLP